ncbi:MAG: SDR family oxidoreductase [Sphingomonadales bacterium]|nr:SDR family oxidoreductase [Sphingomonadales bacterium]
MGQGALITGAGDSVGRVIAEKMRARGDRVYICDIREDAVAETLAANPGMAGSVRSIADAASVAGMFRDVADKIGPLTTLVNCVGVAGPRAPVDELDDAEWRKTFDVNVHGILYTMQHSIPHMKQNGGGAIINFSTSSTRTRLPFRTAYVASKFALEGLTLNAARELGVFGIRCNAILPGIIDNDRMRRIIEQRAADQGVSTAELERDYLKYISTRSKVSMAELAETVLFLTSEAVPNITGELISVSGNLEWEE